MKRRITIALLGLGVLLGYGGFIARLRHGPPTHGPWAARRAAFEKRVASVCAEAALDARARAEPPVGGAR
jgi:hypothetical protein